MTIEATLKVAEGGSSRPLDVDDFKAPATGAATESNLTALKNASHTDLTALATAVALLVSDAHFQAFVAANHTDLAALLAKNEVIRSLLAGLAPLTDTQLRAAPVPILPGPGAEFTLADTIFSIGDPIPTLPEGTTYGYTTGSGGATVDVPVDSRVRRVSVIGNASTPTTVTIAGGATITIPAGRSFTESIPGQALLGGDVVIGGGASQAYYVAWASDV